MRESPVIVVGAGLAGLWTALELAPLPVVLLAGRSGGRVSASAWAQGGIAAARGEDDDPARHAADTVAAGAGLVDAQRALQIAEAAPGLVARLSGIGVAFTRDSGGGLALAREAAHSRPRIVHADGDATGAALVRRLREAVGQAAHVRLHCVDATGLLHDARGRCAGVRITDGESSERLMGRAVVLATGGLGGLFAVTTNPPASRGRSLAWAARLGATIRDAEFIQFHPTALDVGACPAPLATEALRGAGAILVDGSGHRFMPDLHDAAELAPRDVVARAVAERIAEHGGAFLDATREPGPAFPRRFPTVWAACRKHGIDPRTTPIPIAPAAHYSMGGIEADLDGRCGVEGLFAIGEAACTGVHGANRLASNSLLEALVTADRSARALLGDVPASSPSGVGCADPEADLPPAALDSLRRAMHRRAGVRRDASGLGRLCDGLAALTAQHGETDAVRVASFIADAALARGESRGAHFREDHPAQRTAGSSRRRIGAGGHASPTMEAA